MSHAENCNNYTHTYTNTPPKPLTKNSCPIVIFEYMYTYIYIYIYILMIHTYLYKYRYIFFLSRRETKKECGSTETAEVGTTTAPRRAVAYIIITRTHKRMRATSVLRVGFFYIFTPTIRLYVYNHDCSSVDDRRDFPTENRSFGVHAFRIIVVAQVLNKKKKMRENTN